MVVRGEISADTESDPARRIESQFRPRQSRGQGPRSRGVPGRHVSDRLNPDPTSAEPWNAAIGDAGPLECDDKFVTGA